MSKPLRDLKFKCLVCGDKLPTKKTTVRRHFPAYVGWRNVEETVYDTSKDGYFVRTLTPDIFLNHISPSTKKSKKENEKYYEKFIDLFSRKYEYYFGVDSRCFQKILDNSSRIIKDTYITNLTERGYDINYLKIRPTLSLKNFSELFEYLSDFVHIPKYEEEIELEIIHFSEYGNNY